MLRYSVILVLFLSLPLQAQNLIRNHDFSTLDTCVDMRWNSNLFGGSTLIWQNRYVEDFIHWFTAPRDNVPKFSPWDQTYIGYHKLCVFQPVDTAFLTPACGTSPTCKYNKQVFPPPVEGLGYVGMGLLDSLETEPFTYYYYDPCCSSAPSDLRSIYLNLLVTDNYSTFPRYGMRHDDDYFGKKKFLETKLKTPLQAGIDYTVEFSVIRWNNSIYVADNIGAYLSQDTFRFNEHYGNNITPQILHSDSVNDDKNWTHIKGSFVANGGESYLTLGNFVDHIGYKRIKAWRTDTIENRWFFVPIVSYFFDAVYVYKSTDSLFTVQLPADTTLCFGDTLRLHAQHSHTFKLEATKRFRWSTGSVDSSITISQPGTYWVEVSYNNRWRQYDTIVVDYIPPYYSGLPRDTTICAGSSLELSVPMQHNVSHRWSTGATGTQVILTQEGDYTLESYNECDTFVSKIQVRYFPTPEASLPMDTILCAKDSVKLSVPFYTYASYYWSNGSTKPWATYRQEGFASLSLRTHCDTLELMTLIREDDCNPPPVYVPNSFSPNGDGLNDTWYIEGLPEQNELIILNRWGEQILKASPYQNHWDGRLQNGELVQPGIYTYILRYSGLIGRDETKAGWLNVLGN